MSLRLGTKIKHKIWQPAVRRWGVIGGIAVIAIPVAIIVGGGVTFAQLYGNSSSSSSSVDLQRGLVGWWKLNGNTKDSTPYANNGTNAGGVSSTTDREGTSNSAMSFSGTSNGYLNIGTPSNLAGLQVPLTISGWFNTNSSANFQPLYGAYTSATGGNLWSLVRITRGVLTYETSTSSGGYQSFGSMSVSQNVWHFFTIVVSGTISSPTLTIYLDGNTQNFSMSALDSTPNTSVPIYIGGDAHSGTERFSGSIDDIRVYNRTLSAAEVTTLYNEYNPSLNTSSGENGLVGWWKLNGNANDSTPYGDNGTINGGVAAATDREGTANGAMSFNGSNGYISVPSSTNLQVGRPDLTFAAWINPSSTACSSPCMIFHKPTHGYEMFISGGKLGFALGNSSPGWSSTYTVSIPANQWSYVVLTYDATAGVIDVYYNGTLVYTDASASGNVTTTTGALTIGAASPAGTPEDFFNGSISDVRIYNRTLSQTDVTNLYNSYNSQINLNTNPSGSTNPVNNIYSGLVGFWPFTGNANDATPYSDNGTLSSPPPTLTTNRLGQANSAYSFAAASHQLIRMGSPQVTTAFTYTGWFEINSFASSWSSVFGDFHYASPPNGADFIPRSGKIAVCEGGNTGTYGGANCSISFSSSAIQTGTWIFGALVYDGTTLSVYVNGQSIGSTTIVITHVGTTFVVGRWSVSYSDYYFDGSISDVRIYNRALSASEVVALYNND